MKTSFNVDVLEDIFIAIVKNDEPAAGNPPKKDGAVKADAAGEEK